MHGDVHPGNLVLALTDDIDDNTETEIEAKNRRGNELNDPGDSYTLDDKVDVLAGDTTNTNIILVDLGASSTPADAPSDTFAYPIPYRAPEVVMDTGCVTAKADIWALGCVIYRIITGNPLFAPEGWGSIDDTNIEQIVSFVERLGPVPDSLRTAWVDSDRHLTSDGLLKDPFPEDERELPLTETIREAKPEGMGDDEVMAFTEFLSLIFHFEPAERSSTQELLQHRWVTDWGND
jgi:serine/threonine-protein kinase SRPK3